MTKKQYNAILEYIRDFEGATIDAQTGNIALLDAGYMVSLAGYEKKTKKLTFRALQKAQKEAQKNNAFLGLWVSDGFIYIDLSICVNTIQTAFMLGRKNEQLAIFDNNTKQSIYLK